MNNDGKILKGENGLDFLMIESKENVALLKSLAKDEYVVANGYRTSNDNKISWNYGSYYQNLMQATIKFDELTLENDKRIENLKDALKEASNFVSFGAIVEFELNKEKEKLDEFDMDKLEIIYDECNSNNLRLISDYLEGLEEEYNLDKVKENISDYLNYMGVNIDKVTDEKLAEMAEDVITYALETDDITSSLIWNNEYFEGEIENLPLKDEEEEI